MALITVASPVTPGAYVRPQTDLIGAVFGRLRVISFNMREKNGKMKWLCQCQCGNFVSVRIDHLRSGAIQSCKCLNNEMLGNMRRKHQATNTPTFRIWVHMRQRCINPKDKAYKYYGARGITVCDRWNNYLQFLEDMGEQPKGFEIERINNDGPYAPENCRWATRIEQANNKRNNKFLSIDGQTTTIAQWARLLGFNYKSFWAYTKRG